MKAKITLISFIVLFIAILTLGPARSQAQTQIGAGDSLTTEATRMDRMSGTLGDPKVTDKLSAEFSSFLGADAKAVITGMRNGTPIVLTTTNTTTGSAPGAPPVTTTTTTTITPPTGKMGFGNVFISLALAKQQLSQSGITQPTPAQLQAALLGGTITSGTSTTATSTTLPGILTMRSQNMGWGQIAQKLGFKLGTVVSGLKAANHGLVMGVVSPSGGGIVSASGQPVGSSESGVVTGSGRAVGRSGKGQVAGSEGDNGVVNGMGRSVGSEGGITTGRGHGYGGSGGGPASSGHGGGRSR